MERLTLNQKDEGSSPSAPVNTEEVVIKIPYKIKYWTIKEWKAVKDAEEAAERIREKNDKIDFYIQLGWVGIIIVIVIGWYLLNHR